LHLCGAAEGHLAKMARKKRAASGPPAGRFDSARVLAKAPTVIYVHDVNSGGMVFLNRQIGALLGYPADNMPKWSDIMHPDDLKALAAYGKRIRAIRDGETLSFEYRVRDAHGDWHWFATRDTLLSIGKDGKPRFVVGSASDVTEQKQAQEHKDVLLHEMQHRTRNLTALIDAIARQSMPAGEPAVEAYYKTFIARLRALFGAAEIVMGSQRRQADLGEILKAALSPFSADTGERLRVEGPSVQVQEQTAASVALAIHELATNAMKYGALSTPDGQVSLLWSAKPKDNAAHVEIVWTESGGPPVRSPSREGFGSRVIRYATSRERDGSVALAYEPSGVTCRIGFTTPGEQTSATTH
jgi:PAS domain S-box-containing protein